MATSSPVQAEELQVSDFRPAQFKKASSLSFKGEAVMTEFQS